MNKMLASMEPFELQNTKPDALECSCLTNIGLYIIQKIREEDLREDNMINIDEADENQKLLEEEIKSKINITEMILSNKDILIDLEDFYEEECQLSLLNWACDIQKKLRQKRNKYNLDLDYYENLNKDSLNKNSLNNNQEILLFNILNIFEIFPIKPDDLKSLNFIDKLKKIKKDMKNQNIIIYKKIKNLIKFWKSMIKLFDNHKKKLAEKKNLNLNKKRQREESEIKEDNEIYSSNLSIYETDSCEQNEIKKKNVTWKNDEILIEKIEFDPNEAPLKQSEQSKQLA